MAPGALSPHGLRVASLYGNLWFTEQVGNKIGRVTTAGAFTELSALQVPPTCPAPLTCRSARI
jgi:hypothetical protein